MEFLVGTALASFVCGAAAWLGMDRERVFYPAVLIATASYYVAFAVVDGGPAALWSEVAIAAPFLVLAVLGFKRNPWLVVAALLGHGVMDVFHEALVHNTGVPQGWPGFCLMFDVTAAVIVGCVLVMRARRCRSALGAPRFSVNSSALTNTINKSAAPSTLGRWCCHLANMRRQV